ncbi:Calcium-responsive transcription factor [Holothuria leucospilota]|uniref:Calcium-responsive transcription factor n=1 Tax=Holothuria leucospilota TaxID=206669 RepID=A0A9Q1BHI5_HOLLE|nr:Calcium-responsive transcription factor [Holothuria leucospilota]
MADSSDKTTTDEGDPLDLEFPKLFYVGNMDSVRDVIQNYELKTRTQFAGNRESKHFDTNWSIYSEPSRHRITWQDREGRYERIPYDGIPFFVVGKRSMSCTFGPTYRSKVVEKNRKENELMGKKNRRVPPRSVDCPALISIREIHKFPEFCIPDAKNTKSQREKVMRALKEAIQNKTVTGERRFYVTLPRMSDHKGHDFDKDVYKLRTDPRVTKKITDLIYRRVFDPKKLKELVIKYVQEDLFKDCTAPPLTDARFYPSQRRILNISYNTRTKMQEEGIAVPIPLLSDPRNRKKKKKRLEEVKRQEGNAVYDEALVEKPVDAAEMLLMLDQPCREEEVEMTMSSDEDENEKEGGKSSEKEDSERSETANVQVEEVVELHPDKQDCLDLIERIKPLILFTNNPEPIGRLKEVLERTLEELENGME